MTILIILGVCVLLCFGLIALAGWWGLNQLNNNIMPFAMCSANVEMMQKALRDYAVDHGNKLPPASKWQDELKPYMEKELKELKEETKDSGPFRIPVMDLDKAWGCDRGDQSTTTFVFNKDLDGKPVADIPNRESTPIIFEVPKAGKNAAEKYTKQDPTTSGKMMGQTRGWAVIMWDDYDFVGGTIEGKSSSSRN